MTDEEKAIIEKEIILAYYKLSSMKNKPTARLKIAINIGLKEAELKINNNRKG